MFKLSLSKQRNLCGSDQSLYMYLCRRLYWTPLPKWWVVSMLILRGAWCDRDTNDIFAHCYPILFTFFTSNFPTLFGDFPPFSTLNDHSKVPRQTFKSPKKVNFFVARTMVTKWAKFHGDSPTVKKLTSISRARLTIRRRPFCVQLCLGTLYNPATSAFDQLFL